MEKTADRRIYALDGIRGIAIVIVVLTHVTSSFIQAILPPFLARVFFSSGVTGVSLLFILSGFFMALMYPDPKDRAAFIHKRYTRIFPVFLMMCLLTVIVRIIDPHWYTEIALYVALALSFYVVWVHIAQRYASAQVKRWVFYGFVAFQFLVGGFYYFYVMRQPSNVFGQEWSLLARESMTGLVNGTLTLPLGNYIPMIDGVYWSLAAEVLFYILYAIICVPLIKSLIPIKRAYKLFLLLILIPFFGGLHILATRLLGLSLLRPEFGYYFVTGIVLGYLYRTKKSSFETIHRFFPSILGLLPLAFFFACVMVKDQSFQYVPRTFDPWLHILWAIPMTLAIALTLDPKMLVSKVFRWRGCVYLGTISYSMYLSHSLTLHLLERNMPITNASQDLVYVLLTLILTIVGSTFLYTFLEKPYFNRSVLSPTQTAPTLFPWFRRPTTVALICGLLLYAGILIAYQSNFNFFSMTVPVTHLTMESPTVLKEGKADMSANPTVKFSFVSPHDDFGVLTLKLVHVSKHGEALKKQRLNFSIKEDGQSDWYATNSYALEEIGATDGDPYGFPVIRDATGKTYDVEFSLEAIDSPDSAVLDLSSVSGVYTVSKKDILTHPLTLVRYTLARVEDVFVFADAKRILVYVTPTFLFFLAVYLHKRDPNR